MVKGANMSASQTDVGRGALLSGATAALSEQIDRVEAAKLALLAYVDELEREIARLSSDRLA
jgi:hypothetical protein